MVSAIILAFNRKEEALKTIGKLEELRQSLPFELEIIIVDNASKDGTSAAIKERHPDLKLISRSINNGIAGWNDGFAVAKHEYLLVLDDDSHVHSGLDKAIKRLEDDPTIGILGFETTDENLKLDVYLAEEDAWKDKQDVPGFIGCGAIIRKELYDKIGGFAEWIFVYTHEFEYAIRCWNAGYRVSFFAEGYVIHRVSKLNRSFKRLRIFGTRNELAIIYKYFDKDKSKFLFRIVMNNLKFIKREGLLSGYYVLQGVAEYFKLKKELTRTPVRQKIQDFYAANFWATKPILTNLKKRLNI
ncbi:glycosyltransferase [Pedobacter chinensis]|uniref:Glycosyltransferase n=1 Tax=Pedobacter chinensis TaxID=2282421 RepID=A0A369Q0G3_9SPHI|nr:glycosyltransferase [Pedobacter chinensis]RDC55828.1 glycosyltransferase [Pedobacter chinensis]